MSGRKRKNNSCPVSSSKKPKRRKSGGTHRFSVEQDLLLERPWVTLQPRRVVEGTQTRTSCKTASTSRTKLLENGCDSETSTTRDTDVHADIHDVDL